LRGLLDRISSKVDAKNEIINFNDTNISYYDYEHNNDGDDFVEIINKFINSDGIILCTPLYWYSMSGQMKTFVDRFSDLITIKKDLGRKLKGKKLYLVSCGYSDSPPDYFEKPFIDTCNYFEINYKGMLYSSVTEEAKLSEAEFTKIDAFAEMINKNL